MNRELAIKVADAVLYEGYMLYPYRPSAIKNRQRWSFGILYPPDYQEVRAGTERASMHSECLLAPLDNPTLQIQLRFLHLVSRQVFESVEERLVAVEALRIDEHLTESWDEAAERSVEFQLRSVGDEHRFAFEFSGEETTELLQGKDGQARGSVVRQQRQVTGTVLIATEKIGDSVLKLSLEVNNTSPMHQNTGDRDSALLHSFLSAHVILAVTGGEFISLLDPPTHLQEAARACSNVGNFPVLVGSEGERDMLLCSPILLYDYPRTAPESAGDFYDSTEMDEMLTLRVLTLTNDEKTEMSRADDRARALLERTQQTAREQLMKTHGAVRSLRSVSE